MICLAILTSVVCIAILFGSTLLSAMQSTLPSQSLHVSTKLRPLVSNQKALAFHLSARSQSLHEYNTFGKPTGTVVIKEYQQLNGRYLLHPRRPFGGMPMETLAIVVSVLLAIAAQKLAHLTHNVWRHTSQSIFNDSDGQWLFLTMGEGSSEVEGSDALSTPFTNPDGSAPNPPPKKPKRSPPRPMQSPKVQLQIVIRKLASLDQWLMEARQQLPLAERDVKDKAGIVTSCQYNFGKAIYKKEKVIMVNDVFDETALGLAKQYQNDEKQRLQSAEKRLRTAEAELKRVQELIVDLEEQKKHWETKLLQLKATLGIAPDITAN